MLEKCVKLIAKSNKEELRRLLGFDNENDDGVTIISSNLGTLINSSTKKGVIPIHLACKNQDIEILELLLRCKELDVDVRDLSFNSFTPIMTLINSGGDIECINVLLKRKPNLELYDSEFGDTPLHWSVRLDLPLVVHRLVKYGMDVNMPNKHLKYTPLQLAVLCGSEEVIAELVSLSADPLMVIGEEKEYSILHLCILNNMPNSALHILKSVSDSQKERLLHSVDRNGNNALHLASLNGMFGLATSLINEGFDGDTRNYQNLTHNDLRDKYLNSGNSNRKNYSNSKVRERKAFNRDFDQTTYETPVSKFFLRHMIAEKGHYDEVSNRRIMGKHEFVFKLFFKKGYFELDSKFKTLTKHDLTCIGIKDNDLKDKILVCIKKELETEEEIINENIRLEKSYEKRKILANLFTAISTCIMLFFIIYVSLNALIDNGPSRVHRS